MTMSISSRTTAVAGGVLATLLLLLALLPEQARAQGLTYSIVPSARWIDWDDELDFDRSRLLGGAVNIGFGRYVGLTAFYHQDDDASPLPDSDFRTELVQTGGEVTLAFGTGSLVPVVKGGASIIRFRPEDEGMDDFTKLSFDYGAGLRAVLSEVITGELMVESSEYRLARERFTGEALPSEDPIRQNLSLRAGLGIQLGSRTFDRALETDDALSRTYESPFDNFALALEPGFSRFTFDDDLGIADQDAWGGRAGFDFGSFFGLRGFYWRGTEEDELSEFSDFSAWGGEAQFNLGAGPGVNPYLLAGVTHFDWDADTPGAERIHDKNAVTLGGGLDLDVSDRFRLSVAARNNILAASDVGGDLIEEVSDPDDLIHNWQFSAGLSFVLGEGSSGRITRTVATEQEREQERREQEQQQREQQEQQEQQTRDAQSADSTRRAGMRSDTIEMAMPGGRDTRTIVLPVLEEGEVYIRFGPAGATPLSGAVAARPDSGAAPISREALRQLIREEVQTLRDEGSGMDAQAVTEDIEELEERLQARLDRIAGDAGQPAVVMTDEDEESVSRESRELRPYSGVAVSGDTQILLGVASDIGPMWAGSALRLVPQIALGVGEGSPSVLVNASLEYRFNEFSAGDQLRFTPMLSAGPSLLNQDGLDVRLTTFVGTGIELMGMGEDDDESLNLFTGFQGVDFFDEGRLLVGLRLLR